MESIDPEVVAFVRFCAQRRGDHWPDLYDEMCRVASRKLYNGFGYAELKRRGLSLSLDVLDRTAKIVDMAMKKELPPA